MSHIDPIRRGGIDALFFARLLDSDGCMRITIKREGVGCRGFFHIRIIRG
jgi:hypothetical protein